MERFWERMIVSRINWILYTPPILAVWHQKYYLNLMLYIFIYITSLTMPHKFAYDYGSSG